MATLIPTFALSKEIGDTVTIEASTVGDLVAEASARWGAPFKSALASASILVNGRHIQYLQGHNTPLSADDVVWIVQPASGG